MSERLGQVSQGHEMYCHDLVVIGLNPGWVKLGYVVLLEKYLPDGRVVRMGIPGT